MSPRNCTGLILWGLFKNWSALISTGKTTKPNAHGRNTSKEWRPQQMQTLKSAANAETCCKHQGRPFICRWTAYAFRLFGSDELIKKQKAPEESCDWDVPGRFLTSWGSLESFPFSFAELFLRNVCCQSDDSPTLLVSSLAAVHGSSLSVSSSICRAKRRFSRTSSLSCSFDRSWMRLSIVW